MRFPHLTPIAVALAIVAGTTATSVLYVAHLRSEAAELRRAVQAAQARAVSLAAQAQFERSAGAIGETRDRNILQARLAASEAVEEIDNAADLDAALAAYGAGLERVRASADSAGAATADADGGGSDSGG